MGLGGRDPGDRPGVDRKRAPVTNEASSEHSHTTAAASSAGSPKRVMAWGARISRWRSGGWSDISGVMIAPGTPLDADPLVGVLDGGVLGQPEDPVLVRRTRSASITARRPAFDEVLTIAPPAGAGSSICRIWCFMPRNVRPQVDRDHPIEVLVGESRAAADARRCQHCCGRRSSAAEALHGVGDQRLVVLGARDVAGMEIGASAGLHDRATVRSAPSRADSRSATTTRPLGREANRARPADPARRAGHQSDLPSIDPDIGATLSCELECGPSSSTTS